MTDTKQKLVDKLEAQMFPEVQDQLEIGNNIAVRNCIAIIRNHDFTSDTDDWQSMCTAPKDGKEIIFHSNNVHFNGVSTAFFSVARNLWFLAGMEETLDSLVFPEKWLPLPPPPREKEK